MTIDATPHTALRSDDSIDRKLTTGLTFLWSAALLALVPAMAFSNGVLLATCLIVLPAAPIAAVLVFGYSAVKQSRRRPQVSQ